MGDPCVLRMREAVAGGSLPFGCQGPDNGLTIDGGRTIGWELAEQAPGLVAVYVQMGGGALASSLARGLAEGGSDARVIAVQTEGCAPFDRAWRRVEQVGLDEAVHHRSAAMRPWESEPNSAATGILDDVTYDWAGVAAGLELSHGTSVVAPESGVSPGLGLVVGLGLVGLGTARSWASARTAWCCCGTSIHCRRGSAPSSASR